MERGGEREVSQAVTEPVEGVNQDESDLDPPTACTIRALKKKRDDVSMQHHMDGINKAMSSLIDVIEHLSTNRDVLRHLLQVSLMGQILVHMQHIVRSLNDAYNCIRQCDHLPSELSLLSDTAEEAGTTLETKSYQGNDILESLLRDMSDGNDTAIGLDGPRCEDVCRKLCYLIGRALKNMIAANIITHFLSVGTVEQRVKDILEKMCVTIKKMLEDVVGDKETPPPKVRMRRRDEDNHEHDSEEDDSRRRRNRQRLM